MNSTESSSGFDRVNALLAILVFLGSIVAYILTVQPTIPFWDSGEFIACAAILGIPHPPGFPLYMLLARIAAVIPSAADIAHRINLLSAFASAFTAMFSYLLVVKLVNHITQERTALAKYIGYISGLVGGFFVAFSNTNWSNSVEAEVYGLSLAVMVLIAWLTVKYFEAGNTRRARQILVLVAYLAFLGVGIHLTVFLVVPFSAILFILNRDATKREYWLLCGFILLELLMIVIFANGRGGEKAFFLFSAVAGIGLISMIYRYVNWAVTLAWVFLGSIMIGFGLFFWIAPAGLIFLIILAILAEKFRWRFDWRTAIAIMVVGFIGFSVHLFIPIRSSLHPRLNMNNPSRDFRTFVSFLDRKQYGEESMVHRMFIRRGTWENQFFRHPNMGFWSYFEEQYSPPGWAFIPFLLLGLIGLYVALRKRLELGLPFLTLFLICTVGLILYMNFADGTKFNPQTGDAYLEVRNRDYFFTPAFVFFGVAMGVGVAGLITLLKDWVAKENRELTRSIAYAASILVLLPAVSLARNFHLNDRHDNYLPYIFGRNILDSCLPNALLFTTGDNETYPLWALQEAYNYRKDIRVVNQSLLNIDWYILQMKNEYHVPMSFTDAQIRRYPTEVQPGVFVDRPREMINDRPRGVRTYLMPYRLQDRFVTVADIVVDDIVIANRWQYPMYFTSPPSPESPLKLNEHTAMVGVVDRLDREPPPSGVDIDTSFTLLTRSYHYRSLGDPFVYRDPDVSRDFIITLGSASGSVLDAMLRAGDTARYRELLVHLTDVYPQFAQAYGLLAGMYEREGDTAKADSIANRGMDTLRVFIKENPDNRYYLMDLGVLILDRGLRNRNEAQVDQAIDLMWKAFLTKPNDSYIYRRLVMTLTQQRRYAEVRRAAQIIAQYKRYLYDPFVQQSLHAGEPADSP